MTYVSRYESDLMLFVAERRPAEVHGPYMEKVSPFAREVVLCILGAKGSQEAEQLATAMKYLADTRPVWASTPTPAL